MPRRNRERFAGDLLEATMYKWEFLRRNKKYIADYEKVNSIKNKAKFAKAGFSFAQKYGVTLFLNPNYSFFARRKFSPSKKTWSLSKSELVVLVHLFREQEPVQCLSKFDENKNEIYFDLPELISKVDGGHTIIVSINLDTPNEVIIERLERIIKLKQETFRRLAGKGPLRLRLEEYRNYLLMYDLHESGHNYKSIAAAAYPSQEGAVDRVRKNIQAAKTLIDGKYRRIR